MTNPIIKIHDAETGEEIEREMTKDELKLHLADQARIQNFIKTESDVLALKASAKAKLIAGEPLTAAEADTLVI